MNKEEEDPLYLRLESILLEGQEKKVFSSDFQPKATAILINGAASKSMLLQSESFDIENYQQELIKMVAKIVKI